MHDETRAKDSLDHWGLILAADYHSTQFRVLKVNIIAPFS